jgi:hypothetical protein
MNTGTKCGTTTDPCKVTDMTEVSIPEHFKHIMTLEELVCSKGLYARHFTFEPPILASMWQVMLGDKGLLICKHGEDKLDKLLIENPNFTMLFKDFDYLKTALLSQGIEPSEPILCWLRGLIHAFMAENPNVIQCEATLTGTSGLR